MENSTERLIRWFTDPDTWVGVYENKELGHPDLGHRIAYPYTLESFDKAKIGDRAPDTRQYIGWRYLLIAKCRTVEECLQHLEHDAPQDDGRLALDTPERREQEQVFGEGQGQEPEQEDDNG